MISDFPHNIRIRLAQLKFFLLPPDVAKSLPCWLSQFSFSKLRQPTGQRLSNVRMQQTKISIVPILFLCYEESLVSSNLNSKQLRFHVAHPNLHTFEKKTLKNDLYILNESISISLICSFPNFIQKPLLDFFSYGKLISGGVYLKINLWEYLYVLVCVN